jgi:hypothetical protein
VSARLLHESRFYQVELSERAIIKVVRKNQPFEKPEDVDIACNPVQRVLDAIGRPTHCLLIDTRLIMGRNDPISERMFADHRKRMAVGFRGIALICATSAGKLHSMRLLSEDRTQAEVFLDELDALAYLRALLKTSTKPPRQG